MPLINTAHYATTPVDLGLPSQKTYNTIILMMDTKHRVSLNEYEEQSIPSLITYMNDCSEFPVADTCTESIAKIYYAIWVSLTPSRVRNICQKVKRQQWGI